VTTRLPSRLLLLPPPPLYIDVRDALLTPVSTAGGTNDHLGNDSRAAKRRARQNSSAAERRRPAN